jgi:hypothetical protein
MYESNASFGSVRLKAQFWCSNPRLRNPHSKEPSNVCSSGAVYTNLWLRFLAHETLFNQAEVEAFLSRGFASMAVKTGGDRSAGTPCNSTPIRIMFQHVPRNLMFLRCGCHVVQMVDKARLVVPTGMAGHGSGPLTTKPRELELPWNPFLTK